MIHNAARSIRGAPHLLEPDLRKGVKKRLAYGRVNDT
jgi:hypothetical protein